MSNQIEKDHLLANGIRTHVLAAGKGETIVFVHGGGAGADAWGNWKDVLPRFAAEGYRAVAMDMVGFGESEKPDPAEFEYTSQARIDHLAATIQALGTEKVSLVGNSMGGATSLGVCMQRPELVNKLVLLGSAGRHRPVRQSQELQSVLHYTPGRDQMRKIVQALTFEDFEIDDALIDYRLKVSQSPGTMAAYAATMKWVGEHGMFYTDDELSRIPHKTFVIHGKNDRMVPLEDSLDICKLIKNAGMYVIPNCGHWAMIEHPDAFCSATFDFLRHA